jgi:hypothetical protein
MKNEKYREMPLVVAIKGTQDKMVLHAQAKNLKKSSFL